MKKESKFKTSVLFLCTGNACRSQMAEGLARHLKKDELEAHSAGVAPRGVDPRAVKAMAELGIDISNQRSKSIDELKHMAFDYVVTLCDNAQKSCPSFPGRTQVIHVAFEDPPKLAAGIQNEEEAMGHYRRVRDEIRALVEQLPRKLMTEDEGKALSQQRRFQTMIRAVLDHLPEELIPKKDK